MSEERQQKCLEYKMENDRKLCIASDMLVRSVLSEITGIDKSSIVILKDENMKPYIEGNAVYFNFSHCEDFVALAVNKHCPVGVDIEKIRPVKKTFVERICTEREKEFIFNGKDFTSEVLQEKDVQERFFRIWTYKEAYLKCTGQGISDNLKLTEYDKNGCFQRISDGFCITVVVKNE